MKYLKTLLIISVLTITGVLVVRTSFALTPEEEAARLGITFPITELGNCANVSDCMAYCDNPANYNACTEFAKKHGFHQEPPVDKQDILSAAKSELGCDSQASCMKVCDDFANRQKCADFARKHGLEYQTAGPPAEIMTAAKSELGCDSPESCFTYCQAEGNWTKCEEFFRKHGFEKPARVKDEYSDFCQKYPEKCQGGDRNGDYDGFCAKNPQKCQIKEQEFCQKYPEKCQPEYSPPASNYQPPGCPAGYHQASDGVCIPENTSQAEYDCNREGKYWDGTSCRDSYQPPEGSYSPPPDYSPSPQNYSEFEGGQGDFQQYEQQYQQQSLEPDVQGVQTQGLLQRMVNFIFGIFRR